MSSWPGIRFVLKDCITTWSRDIDELRGGHTWSQLRDIFCETLVCNDGVTTKSAVKKDLHRGEK